MNMQASGPSNPGPEELEIELRRSLYRFDCPDAHTLGEYELDMLDMQSRVQIATHVNECDDCRGELHTLRLFVATPTRAPESLVERARHIVATLVAPPATGLYPAYGGFRGTAESSTQVYEAGDVTVTLAPGQGRGTLIGLVLTDDREPELLEGSEVRLVPREGAVRTSTLDDLGNFEFVDLPAGLYALETYLPDTIVVIEELRID